MALYRRLGFDDLRQFTFILTLLVCLRAELTLQAFNIFLDRLNVTLELL